MFFFPQGVTNGTPFFFVRPTDVLDLKEKWVSQFFFKKPNINTKNKKEEVKHHFLAATFFHREAVAGARKAKEKKNKLVSVWIRPQTFVLSALAIGG